MSEKIEFVVRCQMCDCYKSVSCTLDQYDRWQSGEYIQNAIPQLSVDERELLMSKICGDCFDKMYEGDSDDE